MSGFRAFTTAKDGSKCLAMEYGGERSLNDLIEMRREQGLQAFPVATVEKVALHVARGLQVLTVLVLSDSNILTTPTQVCLLFPISVH